MSRTGFASPPATLDVRQRTWLIVATIVSGAARLLAVARSPWDWDEMLFLLGMRQYDVSLHHPHPPGFPLYIAAAKAIAFFGVPDFRSLQVLSVVAGVLLLPCAFLLCRELRYGFSASFLGALLLAFAPNVWFYGGAALSYVP
jgi:hypothetical protein